MLHVADVIPDLQRPDPILYMQHVDGSVVHLVSGMIAACMVVYSMQHSTVCDYQHHLTCTQQSTLISHHGVAMLLRKQHIGKHFARLGMACGQQQYHSLSSNTNRFLPYDQRRLLVWQTGMVEMLHGWHVLH
jgi:hypothetical protein